LRSEANETAGNRSAHLTVDVGYTVCATLPNHLHKRQTSLRVQKFLNPRGFYIAMALM
jgi:hypothetical protein